MNAIIDAAFHHTRMVVVTLVVLFSAGCIAYMNIPKEAEPEIKMPLIFVQLRLEGVSPGDAERLLIRPVEEEMQALQGIKEVRATGFQGGASIVLEFVAETKMERALDDVREAMGRARPKIPADADEPFVREFNNGGFPILTAAIAGDVPERTLLHIAQDLRDHVAQLPDVLEANVSGVREEQVEIVIDPLRLEHYGITNNELFQIISRSNRLVAAGNLDTGQGKFAVKVPGLFEDVEDIWNLPIKADTNGTVKLSDVAQIGRTFKDASTYVRVDGRRAVTLDVVNRRGTNVINSVDAIKSVISRETKDWPSNIKVEIINDRSVNVKMQLGTIENGVILAIFLVMAACMALLGTRNGMLVGLAIPGSFLSGILVMYAMGLSINFVAVFGLILVTGMLVDDAIIVVENADRRIMAGQKPKNAYADSAKRLAVPVITSTLTTVAAFVPLMFWPGFIGQFMGLLPFTVIAVLMASLVMGLVFVPAVGGMLKPPSSVKCDLDTVDDKETVQPGESASWTQAYKRLLNKALDHPGRVLAISVFLLFAVPTAFFMFGKGMTLNPAEEPRTAALRIKALGNMSLAEQDNLVKQVEQRLSTFSDFDHIYTRTGRPAGATGEDEDVIGEIRLLFKEWNERRPADIILADAIKQLKDLPGIIVETRKTLHLSNDVSIEMLIASKFPEALVEATHKIRQGMNHIEGLRNVDDTLPLPGIEWELDVNRTEAAKFGADLAMVGDQIRLITNGLRLGRYRPNDSVDEVDIVVRYPAEYRNLSQLDSVRVEARDGSQVPTSNFVTRKAVQKVTEVQRVDGKRILKITAGTAPGVFAGDKVKEIKKMISGLNLDERVEIHFKGEEELRQQNSSFLVFAFGSAIFLIAMILLAEFNSFFAVALILSAVILSTIGVFAGLLIAQTPFIMTMTGVGVIACAGVIVKNNIVLLDTFNIFKHEIDDTREAIFKTCMQRLRPILLTNLTAIVGLVPIAMQLHVDFFHRAVEYGTPALQFWKHLAIALIYGLGFATALTLVVTPSVLMLQHNLAARRRARKAAAGSQALPSAEIHAFHRPAAE
ncbi:MAG: efflux RND transporter permease subunit [Rhodospirillaceae bacterium]|nr:efflux RND transporter permease subunit [Rhodospirillaceae bacterium]